MGSILPRGNPKSRIWCVTDKPYEKDAEKGSVFSCPYGFVFDRAWKDAGIRETPFICAISDLDSNNSLETDYKVLLAAVDFYKPPLICPLGTKATALFCPETRQVRKTAKKGSTDEESSLEKWAGSLLISPEYLSEHYCIPLLKPDSVVNHWEYRFIYVNIDMGHVRDEFGFLDKNKRLQPLPVRELITEPEFNVLMEYIDDCRGCEFVATDIETIRPTKQSEWYGKCPGYPYTVSLADSPRRGISFSLWDYNEGQTCRIFRALDEVFSTVGQIGQNYFTFDAHFLEAMGFNMCLGKCEDTMLRHQLLWPELSHKLQFLTKQYTRQPYYKDDGKHWSPKFKDKLMRYNALDSVITFEVFIEQEKEFEDRPYLR